MKSKLFRKKKKNMTFSSSSNVLIIPCSQDQLLIIGKNYSINKEWVLNKRKGKLWI